MVVDPYALDEFVYPEDLDKNNYIEDDINEEADIDTEEDVNEELDDLFDNSLI